MRLVRVLIKLFMTRFHIKFCHLNKYIEIIILAVPSLRAPNYCLNMSKLES